MEKDSAPKGRRRAGEEEIGRPLSDWIRGARSAGVGVLPEVRGELYGEAPGATRFQVGAFAGPRIHGQPAAWATPHRLGPFHLELPPGTWYLHAAVQGRATVLTPIGDRPWGDRTFAIADPDGYRVEVARTLG